MRQIKITTKTRHRQKLPYPGCIVDEAVSGELFILSLIKWVNLHLKLPHRILSGISVWSMILKNL